MKKLQINENQKKLLFLISLYSRPAFKKDEKEKWMRSLPLHVFMHEGIINQENPVFDWDYAPQSVDYLDGRRFLNITQEGSDDINDLRELGLINGMRISTSRHQYITAYQISKKGFEALEDVEEEFREIVRNLVNCPCCRHLLRVNILPGEIDDGGGCRIYCSQCSDFEEYPSQITEPEDVSYVSSPYIPNSLIKNKDFADYQKMRDGFHNQNILGNNIRDSLDEVFILSEAKLLIGEWVPFGTNHLVLLNDKLGSDERVKSALFTQEIDEDTGQTELMVNPGLTQVFVRDFFFSDYVNFNAYLEYPESEGIVQIEEFGVHISSIGRLVYGLNIEDIEKRGPEDVSLDHLSRVIADVTMDSSRMMDTLLTTYQKNLVELVFRGKSYARDKYTFLVAKKMVSQRTGKSVLDMNIEEILDREDHENELKQITDDITDNYKLEDGSLLLIGRHGSVLITEYIEKYEIILADFLYIKSFEIFLQNFYTSLFVLNDMLRDIRKDVEVSEEDPNAIERVQTLLSKVSSESVLMGEISSYLKESLSVFLEKYNKRNEIHDKAFRNIGGYLKIRERANGALERLLDLDKIIQGTLRALDGMREISEVISERQMHQLQEALQNNTRNLEGVSKASERQGASLQFVEIILSGALAFDILDRFTGEWSVMDAPWAEKHLKPIIEMPLVWMLISFGLWFLIAWGIHKLMDKLEKDAEPVLNIRKKVNAPYVVENLEKFLEGKELLARENEVYNRTMRRKVSFREENKEVWDGYEPFVELVYDEKNCYILEFTLEIQKPGKLESKRATELFMNLLYEDGVIQTP